jgi:hypothetical protein
MIVLTGPLQRSPQRVGDGEPLDTLTITDAEGEHRRLYFGTLRPGKTASRMYDLPPLPPTGIMDARYASNQMFAFADSSGDRECPIRISSAKYPVTVSWTLRCRRVSASLRAAGRLSRLSVSGSVVVRDPATPLSLVIHGVPEVPTGFALGQNYPNPFNPTTTLTYAVPVACRVRLRLYSITGSLVYTVYDGWREPDYYRAEWSGLNSRGERVASGVYLCRLEAAGFTATRKMVLLR